MTTAVTPLGPVQAVPTGKLAPYPANARKITAKAVEQTAESLREFGWQQPLVCDKDMVLVAGHVRWRAAQQLGLAEVPVVVADTLTPAQARAYRIADNRTHDYTAWDYGILAAELGDLDKDFAKVLDLADWQGVIDGFEESQQGRLTFDDSDSENTAALLGHGYPLTVVFESQDAADAAGPAILALPGVLNVRHARNPGQ